MFEHAPMQRAIRVARSSPNAPRQRRRLLVVGAADDSAEREADRIADLVVRRGARSSDSGPPHWLSADGQTRIRRSDHVVQPGVWAPPDRLNADGPTRIQRADDVVQRVIHKKKTTRSDTYSRIAGIDWYQTASQTHRDLLDAMLISPVAFTIVDVQDYLARTPAPTIGDVTLEKQAVGSKKTTVKRNEAAKAKQKQKSKEVQGGGAGLRVNFKKTVLKKSDRTITKAQIKRGAIAIGLGQLALKNILTTGNATTINAVMGHIKTMQKGSMARHQSSIGAATATTNTANMKVRPTTTNDLLAVTHATLKDTNKRSDYAAFVRHEKDQKHGSFHPLQGTTVNATFQLLNAIEALRNDGQFIISMLLKHQAFASKRMTIRNAVNPRKFGTFEIKGVSGASRDDFTDVVSANTAFALDVIKTNGGGTLANALNKILDLRDGGTDTTALEASVVKSIEIDLVALTG